MIKPVFRGVLAPVATPFRADLSPDPERLLRHCRWLLDQGVDGLAVFGTTSEANSLSVTERVTLLEFLVEQGVDPARLMPGTGCCAFTDTLTLTAHANGLGCGGTLMLPPFYYKGVSDEGLFAAYAEVIERTASDELRVYLYHIPPIAQVGLSSGLIRRLITAYPETVVGIKDSSGDWRHTDALLKEFPGFAVFSGSDQFLLDTLRGGGAGCITATANVNAGAICRLRDAWQTDDGERLQSALSKTRQAIQAYPLIPALKSVLADHYGDEGWRRVRPPLVPLAPESRTALRRTLNNLDFSMGAPG